MKTENSFLVEVNMNDVVDTIRVIQNAVDSLNEMLREYDSAVNAGCTPPDIVKAASESMRGYVAEYIALQERLALALTLHATKG